MTTTTTTSIAAAAAGGGGGREDRVLAAAQHIVKSLGNTPKEVREDMLLIFSSFDNRLSNLTSMISDESKEDDRFEAAEKVIFRWESNHDSMMRGSAVPWEDSPDESAEYLPAVDEILSLMEGFSVGSDHENGEVKKRKSKVLENGEVDAVEEQQVKRKKRRKS